MTKVGVIGATGYAGAELVRILAGHPNVKLTMLTSRNYAGEHFSTIYPSMAGIVDMTLASYDIELVDERADVVFTALPHQLPMGFIPELLRRGKKVVDLSADFRFRSQAAYEAHYQPHTAPELLERAVYGLSEVYFDAIRRSDLIGNPGCYPTSVLLPLIPLLKKDMLDPASIVVDSKSGVSGAGRSPSLTTLYCGVTESFKPYKIASHRHNPEMDEILSREAQRDVHVTFVPHLVPMSRGMLTTIYAGPSGSFVTEDIRNCFESYYSGRPFVRLKPEGEPPNTLFVRGTNFCDIGFKFDDRNQRLILVSAIDNLVKGAAGQAVQNMNIMLGLDETAGLSTVPYPL